MAYDVELAERTRHALGARTPFGEIAMFGGLCFTANGNMVVGVVKDDLMVRVGAEKHAEALARAGAREMDFTKRPMKGFLFVGAAGTKTDHALEAWIDRALSFVRTLPPKAAKRSRAASASRAKGAAARKR